MIDKGAKRRKVSGASRKKSKDEYNQDGVLRFFLNGVDQGVAYNGIIADLARSSAGINAGLLPVVSLGGKARHCARLVPSMATGVYILTQRACQTERITTGISARTDCHKFIFHANTSCMGFIRGYVVRRRALWRRRSLSADMVTDDGLVGTGRKSREKTER